MEFKKGRVKDFFEFISRLDEEDKIGIIGHNDPDGICSATMTSRVIGPDFVYIVDYKDGRLKEIIEELKGKCDKVIFLDINLSGDLISSLGDFSEVLVIDHHEPKSEIDMENVILLNSESDIPVSYSSYYLFSKIQEIPAWISAIGIISDLPQKYKKDNHKEVFEDFKLGEKERVWDLMLDFGKALIYFDGEEGGIFEKLLTVSKPGELESKIEDYVGEVDKEIKKWRKRFEEEAEDNLIIFEMNPKFNIKGYLINRVSVSNDYIDKTIVFIQDKDDKTIVSVRSNGGESNCIKLLENALKNIPNSDFGGHIPAAGAVFPRKYREKFKKRMREVYKKINK